MKRYEFDAVVIGSGCAGYNAADTLYSLGVRNIALITEGRMLGTSRNTGSDKQTYYKLSLAGDEGDSVFDMAKTLFDGGGMDGDVALAEAAGSVRAFMKLVSLGVDFPTNEYGEFVGYKTDHDPRSRATSIGPYTSKRMTEALEDAVMNKGIPIIDKTQVIRILTDASSVTGLLALDLTKSGTDAFVAVKTPFVVLATGGPASVYYNSVYPIRHTGSSSLALDAGAEMANLSEWQYGIASCDFRWNVSGTYQQVIPRYISIDGDGVEREFLRGTFDDKDVAEKVFLKGYEWPFDRRKINGSSWIDLLVYHESVLLGRDVFLDYRKNPQGLSLSPEGIGEIAYSYLKRSDALLETPIERLKKMNPGAYKLYLDNGIDLSREPLRIAVSAQHNNGGVRIDANWQSSVKGLYAVGEAAGSLGLFRPGGSALNSSQVGSMRAAMHIARDADSKVSPAYEKILSLAVEEEKEFINSTRAERSTLKERRTSYQKRMSRHFAFKRNLSDMTAALAETELDIKEFTTTNKWCDPREIADLYKNADILKMQRIIGKTALFTAKRFGSRGAAMIIDDSGDVSPESEDASSYAVVADKNGVWIAGVRPIPERELWFERVWAEHSARSFKKS